MGVRGIAAIFVSLQRLLQNLSGYGAGIGGCGAELRQNHVAPRHHAVKDSHHLCLSNCRDRDEGVSGLEREKEKQRWGLEEKKKRGINLERERVQVHVESGHWVSVSTPFLGGTEWNLNGMGAKAKERDRERKRHAASFLVI